MNAFVNRLLGRTAAASPHESGAAFARDWPVPTPATPATPATPREPNPLETWFDAHTEGAGVWKWRHYFEVYHRHLQKYRGQSPVILEIGVYSGGSLEMWPAYFGEGTRVIGVDIEPACRTYERPGVQVLIGDQGDPAFWRDALEWIPAPDIVIDDGSHEPAHQRVTLEAILPALRPGGVYVCEDVHGRRNDFAAFACGLADELHAARPEEGADSRERRSARPTSPFQRDVQSVHFYPFVVVVERQPAPLPELVAPKHGTQWQPFLS